MTLRSNAFYCKDARGSAEIFNLALSAIKSKVKALLFLFPDLCRVLAYVKKVWKQFHV